MMIALAGSVKGDKITDGTFMTIWASISFSEPGPGFSAPFTVSDITRSILLGFSMSGSMTVGLKINGAAAVSSPAVVGPDDSCVFEFSSSGVATETLTVTNESTGETIDTVSVLAVSPS